MGDFSSEVRSFSKLTPTASSLASPLKRQRLNPTSASTRPPLSPTPTPRPPLSAALAAAKPLNVRDLSVMTALPSTYPGKMDIVSPASPMGLRLSSENNKSATVFLSHVRRTFARHPVDYTGELVRLLDDIATFTCSMSAVVEERSHTPVYGSVGTGTDVTASYAIRQLYRNLAHDGYCCIILAKGVEQPLTFDDSVLNGNYVVCVSPLDMDMEGSDEHGVAGMIFSIYKRKSSTSLPGRGIDLHQQLSDQVAAGYASFSSATTLYYTMGHGVFSFVMHPVALQYFLQPPMHLIIPENPTIVYSDRKLLNSFHDISYSLKKMVNTLSCSMYTTGCLVGDLHQLMQTGGVLVAINVHLMCEAAPIAFIIEQCGGVATDETGARILDMAVNDDVNLKVTLVLGTPDSHRNLHISAKPSNTINGGSS